MITSGRRLDEADKAIAEERMLVLNRDLKASQLTKMLYEDGYISGYADAELISRHITERIDTAGTFSNLGSLMKPEMKIHADEIYEHGGDGLKA